MDPDPGCGLGLRLAGTVRSMKVGAPSSIRCQYAAAGPVITPSGPAQSPTARIRASPV
jgi:hypothetical protein